MLFDDIADWMQNFAWQYGYLGIFLISLFAATSIIIPIPSSVVIFIMGGSSSFEPFWIAVAAGLGAVLGEFSGYLVGLSGRKVISAKYKRKMDILTRLFKKFGPVVIFTFALTPLPDDLLFIPLGVMRYGVIRAFIPALLGKFLSSLIIAYAGRFSLQIIRDFFGIGEGASLLIGTILAIVLLAMVLLIMFKVDWEKRAEKFLAEDERQSQAATPEDEIKIIKNDEPKDEINHEDNC